MARAEIIGSEAVYSGRDYLGDVAQLANGQWEAAPGEGGSFGIFASRAEAINAVLASCRSNAGILHSARDGNAPA